MKKFVFVKHWYTYGRGGIWKRIRGHGRGRVARARVYTRDAPCTLVQSNVRLAHAPATNWFM